MKVISWNVNGFNAVMKKGFDKFMKKEDPDIVCLQETKVQDGHYILSFPEYKQYWNCAEKKGYSGTAVFSKVEPMSVSYGIGIPEHDKEGRVITLEFKDFYLVNVYTPNSQRGLTRLKYRMKWEGAFLKFLKGLEKKKQIVFCGDLNVAHEEIDIANPKQNRKNAGFTDDERGKFSRLLDAGFVDTFREFSKEAGQYTWWTYRFNARERNIGWRIDYFCVSKSLLSRLKGAFILQAVTGSDHCPVGIILT